LAVGLDVSDPRQRVAALQQAEARFGAIDFLVNNAGIDFLGAIEEQDEADYRKKALGLAIPESFLVLANKVIE
jgi:NAD(P)-dependent dehydrogenase (short-subunit alcohol dehydrogenase family)